MGVPLPLNDPVVQGVIDHTDLILRQSYVQAHILPGGSDAPPVSGSPIVVVPTSILPLLTLSGNVSNESERSSR